MDLCSKYHTAEGAAEFQTKSHKAERVETKNTTQRTKGRVDCSESHPHGTENIGHVPEAKLV